MSSGERVLVVGGGVIGMSLARELKARECRVVVLDAHDDRQKSSWAAGGMLSPISETGANDALLALAAASLSMYDDWIAQLRLEGHDVGFSRAGKLEVAGSESRAADLKSLLSSWRSLDAGVRWLESADLRQFEPSLSEAPGAIWFPNDAWVDPRALLTALRASARASGVDVRADAPVEEVVTSGGRATAVRLATGEALEADWIIIAAGAWSGRIRGLDPVKSVQPVRGDMLALEPVSGVPTCVVHASDVYLIPRPDRVLVGGSMMREGFDTIARAEEVERLHAAALRVCPGLREAREVERWAGLRPGSPDDLPVIGRDPEVVGLLYATGHFRNGVLLAPATATVIGQLVKNLTPLVPMDPFNPGRFADASGSLRPPPAT